MDDPWLHSRRGGLQVVAVGDIEDQETEGELVGAGGEGWPGTWEEG